MDVGESTADKCHVFVKTMTLSLVWQLSTFSQHVGEGGFQEDEKSSQKLSSGVGEKQRSQGENLPRRTPQDLVYLYVIFGALATFACAVEQPDLFQTYLELVMKVLTSRQEHRAPC